MKKSLIGWIFLDKPIGMSSNLALQKVRNIYENCKAGYIGTLDPLASGFLPIALGKATKTIKYLENSSKEYVFTVQWGLKTTTGDFEGEIISKNKQYPRISSIKRIIKSFSGEIFQTPHRFSSKKINGVRAYKLARKKKKFELKKKSINIYKTKFLRKLSEDKT
ncbi:MAG: tRNA pseudouridine(55) synthase, partial [Rickettsiales bacterium]|nr:tRNA pseudouridine(55) synthase [Rickettsiales bacterium]